MLLEEDGEALVADPDWLGGGGEGELVVAARVAEYLPARSAVVLQIQVLHASCCYVLGLGVNLAYVIKLYK